MITPSDSLEGVPSLHLKFLLESNQKTKFPIPKFLPFQELDSVLNLLVVDLAFLTPPLSHKASVLLLTVLKFA